MRLFGRVCHVTIYRPDGKPLDRPTGFVDKNQDFFETLANGIEVRDLDVSFEIEKSISKQPNTCKIIIFNLNETTRSVITKTRPLTVRLDAGHDNTARFMALGNVKFGETYLKETAWETELELADGGRAFSNARPNKSYKAGTPLRTLVKDAAASMGLQLPTELTKDKTLDNRIPKGATLDGFAQDELTRLLAPLGYGWSVQNGQLQILGDNQVRNDTRRVISANTGLIGSPSFGPPTKKGKRTFTFQTLLYPELMPGSSVLVDSQFVSGPFKLLKVKHTGDTRGDEWTTECEAHPL
jgi:hypothetical protein